MKRLLMLLLIPLAMASCAKRNLSYLSDLADQNLLNNPVVYAQKVSHVSEHRFQPDDMISISVTSLNAESNALFNRGEVIAVNQTVDNSTPGVYREGYLVDKEGNIDFPVLGRIRVSGLTKSELKTELTERLQDYLKGPIVNIRHLNYRITVIGEVNRPASFTITTDKITVLEALGMAGDMTIYGKRENVLIIREEDGMRKIVKLNLNNSNILSSPYFYLKQNDVVYVEPNNTRSTQSSNSRSNVSLGLSVASLVVLILTRFL